MACRASPTTYSPFSALKDADTLLILGVSGCIVLPVVRLFSRKRIVVNIDGLEWKRQKWNRYAKGFLKFSEKMAVKYADTVIADNKVIQEHIENAYGKERALIAYGADDGNRYKNEKKHGLKWQLIEEVFFNEPLFLLEDQQHSKDECRCFALGYTDDAEYLFVVFTKRGKLIRVISARKMNKKERRAYEELKKDS